MNRYSKSKIFLYSCVSFILGISMASFAPERLLVHKFCFFLGALSCWIGAIIFSTKKNKRIYKLHLVFLLGVFLFLGLWRYSLSIPENTSDKIWFFNDQPIIAKGIIISDIEEREKYQRFEFKAEGVILENNTEHKVEGEILVIAQLYPRYNYGDELTIECQLKRPEPFSGFAYDRYLARYDIYSLCYYGFIKTSDTGQGNWFFTRVYKSKIKLRGLINSGLSKPEASLARAILLGDKRGVPSELREKFSQAGLSHIMAISGLHISVIAVMLMYLLINIGLSRKKAYYYAIIILFLYIILIGMPASAMRAGLMGFMVLTALKLGRITRIERSITITAAIILLFNPKLLRDDVGFILSFLAVLGIAFLYPVFESWWERLSIQRGKAIRDIFFITMAVQIFTWPILVYNFSTLSVVAPLSNILVLWILPFIIGAGFMGLILSLILPSLSIVWFLPLKILILYIAWVGEYLSTIPFAFLEFSSPWFGFLVLYFLVLLAIIWRIRRSQIV